MAITVNTNVMSLNAQRNLSTTQSQMSVSLQRLSSGLRVNSAKDDAAGLAIAERMQAQVRGLTVGMRNANDGISLAQTAEGALAGITESLQRMRELAVQSANDTNSVTDRSSLNAEFTQLNNEITRVLTSTKFNGTNILNAVATLEFQVGADNAADNRISINTTDLTTGVASVTSGDVSTKATAQTAIDDIDDALDSVNNSRASFGAVQSRFETAIRSLDATRENVAAARGRIMDTDFASETANLTRTQILQQAGVAMLSQANALPQTALGLLG